MLTETQLDYALDQWRREWGFGGMPRAWPGYSPSLKLADHKGRGPQVVGFKPQVVLGTLADEVETAVKKLEMIDWKAMSVLRCEYLGRMDRPIEAKLDQLRDLGMPQSERTYYRRLAMAKEMLSVEIKERSAA